MITTKIISSMDKCFIDRTTDDFQEITSISMFRNERLSLQFAVYEDKTEGQNFCLYDVVIRGEMAKYARMFVVDSIPVYSVTDYSETVTMEADPTFLRASAGLYPDLLSHPMHKNSMPVVGRQLHSSWFDFSGDDIAPGKYPTEFCLYNGNGELVSSNTVEIEVLPVSLPEQEFKYTNWFYADCLADYYNVRPWSRRHFKICENFIKRASENGINMILMPVFTIPLDTHPSCERTTTQLVGIEKAGDDYVFDFSLCDKWIEMCERCNIKYFEISHLFTQWGATHAPKIIVKENGRKKKNVRHPHGCHGRRIHTFHQKLSSRIYRIHRQKRTARQDLLPYFRRALRMESGHLRGGAENRFRSAFGQKGDGCLLER